MVAKRSDAVLMAIRVCLSQGLTFRTANPFLMTSSQSFLARAFFTALHSHGAELVAQSPELAHQAGFAILAVLLLQIGQEVLHVGLLPGSPHTQSVNNAVA